MVRVVMVELGMGKFSVSFPVTSSMFKLVLIYLCMYI